MSSRGQVYRSFWLDLSQKTLGDQIYLIWVDLVSITFTSAGSSSTGWKLMAVMKGLREGEQGDKTLSPLPPNRMVGTLQVPIILLGPQASP